MACFHNQVHEKFWLPSIKGLSIAHPSCSDCGYIKNISNTKPKGIGYFINILSEMKEFRGEKQLRDVQIRLIINQLRNIEDFEDGFHMTFTIQKSIFTSIIQKYSTINVRYIERYLA
jgi:hypothetical protein